MSLSGILCLILFMFMGLGPVWASGTGRGLVISEQLDCMDKHTSHGSAIGWNDVCDVPNSSSEQRMHIVNKQMDLAEGIISKDNSPPPGEAVDTSMVFPQKPPPKSFIHRFYVSAAYDFNHVHYSEWSGLQKLDEDMGTQRGMYYTFGYRSPIYMNYKDWIKGKPFIEGYYYRPFSSTIRYKGALIGGGPYNGDQRSKVTQMGAKIGGYDDFLGKGQIYGYLDGGKRIWDRGENVLPDYHEKYYWIYTGFGAGVSYPFISKLSVGLDAEMLFAINPRMHADTLNDTFKLGAVWGTEVKLPIKFYVLNNLSLDITPYFTYWKIQASEVLPDGYYEPVSKTHEEGLLSGMTYIF
ncbi:MAG: hypothetical protein KGJ09_06400 [Candidatus Omnitrophica bacterium]|nr:hypothetical protein [Candidatus Omnitrophota bacterium]MDE2231831.1 hypothetical protein [Candidatus Omnitrophota bacterium]